MPGMNPSPNFRSAGIGLYRVSDSEPESKRRKIRKGTRSCWECKRRKIRCEFSSPSDAICIGCRRRHLNCISQEYPEDAHPTSLECGQSDDRDVRVEAMVRELVKLVGPRVRAISPSHSEESSMTAPAFGIPTPSSCNLDLTRYSHSAVGSKDDIEPVAALQPVGRTSRREEGLSHILYAALPSLDDIKTICSAGSRISVYLTEHMRMSRSEMERRGMENSRKKLLNVPGSDTHPVLLGRYILALATFLQYLPPERNKSSDNLSEAPRVMMKRLADLAISQVSRNDSFYDSIEALECIIMEAVFQANIGNLRQAWLATQRSMSLARLMGIDNPSSNQVLKFLDPHNSKIDRKIMWFRIVYLDRFLSLMLGLAPGSFDNGFASHAALATDVPMGKLERIHCFLTSRVLQRNKFLSSNHDYKITEEIEAELRQAADLLPAKWWLAPNLASVGEEATFLETIRMVNQLYHYNLLNQIHLPYLLQLQSTTEATLKKRYEYSKLTCASASREVLNRFVIFRNFNRIAFCCRSADFFALLAAMTLLLVHLDSHRQERSAAFSSNLIAHYRLSDRAIIEQSIESMETVGRINQDTLSEKIADRLRRLFGVEAEAAAGKTYIVEPSTRLTTKPSRPDGQSILIFDVPCFGSVQIIESRISPRNPYDSQLNQQPNQIGCTDVTQLHDEILHPHTETNASQSSFQTREGNFPTRYCGSENLGLDASVNGLTHTTEDQRASQDRESRSNKDRPARPDAQVSNDFGEEPRFDLHASEDEWQYQGTDFAFFDNLAAGSEMEDVGNGSFNRSDWHIL